MDWINIAKFYFFFEQYARHDYYKVYLISEYSSELITTLKLYNCVVLLILITKDS